MANIVICADGTWNRPEEDLKKDFPTNVLRVARAVKPMHDVVKQHVFYDWGLGSYYHSVGAGVTGQGIHKNILDGYRYLVQNFEPGDDIYLFGFSRGAYTVRALSGLINNCGILKRENAHLTSEAWKVYKSNARRHRPNGDDAVSFRQHSHASREVHFVGVWDTVGALGIPFSLMGLFEREDEFYDTKMGPNLKAVRHALAIDEKRVDFEPTIWRSRPGVDLKQVWFAGVHSDVGGSYPPDKETGYLASDVPLLWMLEEAQANGLGIEQHLLNSITEGRKGKLNQSRNHVFRVRRPLNRPLVIQGMPCKIHPSVKYRYEHDPKYRPPQLRALVEAHGWEGLDVGT